MVIKFQKSKFQIETVVIETMRYSQISDFCALVSSSPSVAVSLFYPIINLPFIMQIGNSLLFGNARTGFYFVSRVCSQWIEATFGHFANHREHRVTVLIWPIFNFKKVTSKTVFASDWSAEFHFQMALQVLVCLFVCTIEPFVSPLFYT